MLLGNTDSDRVTAEDPGGGAPVASGGSRRRISGVDVARVIAVAGMVMVHFGPNPVPDTTAGQLYALSHGRASVLFALLAGVGVAFLFRRRASGHPFLGRGRIMLRGALLLPIGLWLQDLDHGVFVILQYYALYFVFAALVVSVPDRWLIAGAAGVLVFGPLIYLVGESTWPEWYKDDPPTIGDSAGKVTRDLLLSGSYPLVTWAAPLLVGVWVGRRNLTMPRVRWILLGVGTILAVAAAMTGRLANSVENPQLADLLTTEPHSQMPLWMAGSIGSALAILGGTLLLSDLLGRAAWPLVAAGQLALSIYVGHLFVLHAYPELVERGEVSAAFASVGMFMFITIVFCTLWRTLFSRGPLEAILGAPWWLIERLIERAESSRQRSDTSREQAKTGPQKC